VRDLARDRNVPLVDAASVMTGHTKWFADFIHFNDVGAGMIAGVIAKRIEQLPVSSRLVASGTLSVPQHRILAGSNNELRSTSRARSVTLASRADSR
jgi:hypothetical protein